MPLVIFPCIVSFEDLMKGAVTGAAGEFSRFARVSTDEIPSFRFSVSWKVDSIKVLKPSPVFLGSIFSVARAEGILSAFSELVCSGVLNSFPCDRPWTRQLDERCTIISTISFSSSVPSPDHSSEFSVFTSSRLFKSTLGTLGNFADSCGL